LFWKPGCQSSADTETVRSLLPINVITSPEEVVGDTCVLSTHVCPFPGEMETLARAFVVPVPAFLDWSGLFGLQSDASPGPSGKWRYLSAASDVPAAEKELLRSLDKPQDGPISRWLNRPISRLVARYLLQSPLTPNAWTLLILILPVIGFFLLMDGHYASIVSGCVIFQLFSILDGCDGEMARAKYLESPMGARIDHFCDQIGNVLFLIGLGLGLYRTSHWGDRLFLESVICAIALTIHELILGRWKEQGVARSNAVSSAYRRHQGMIEYSGLRLLGGKGVTLLLQLTKRDVAVLVFMILAIAGLPQWILHLWLAVTLGSLVLTLLALVRFRLSQQA
jgi:phosphatidylglycerophosphate synthase